MSIDDKIKNLLKTQAVMYKIVTVLLVVQIVAAAMLWIFNGSAHPCWVITLAISYLIELSTSKTYLKIIKERFE